MYKLKLAIRFMLAICILQIASFTAFAAEDKLGFVDAQKVLLAHPKYAAAQKHMEDFVTKKTKETKDAVSKESDADKRMVMIDTARRESGQEEVRIMNPINTDINKAIEKAAKAKGVTVVLNKTLIYFGGVDLTDDVIKELKNIR